MRNPALDKRERLLLLVLLDPAHVLRRLPPMQRMRQRDGRAHEDVVQHHERRQPRRRGGLREARGLEEEQRAQRAERAVRWPRGVEPEPAAAAAAPAFALAFGDEGAQRELELGHVARELQLARFVERLDDRGV